jgi:hypothetical protein
MADKAIGDVFVVMQVLPVMQVLQVIIDIGLARPQDRTTA